ncbi:MAG: FliI/YscN family ATPase [Thermoguttaceae bacterium]|nr:FliI/YscN family ATPase [Thermoguttaceae bacterium]
MITLDSSVFLSNIVEQIQSIAPARIVGSVVRTEGTTISAVGFPAPIGAIAKVERRDDSEELLAEVIGFRDNLTLLYSYSELTGVRRGAKIELSKTTPWLATGNELLGRVVDAFGRTIDSGPAPVLTSRVRYDRKPPEPCARPRIETPLSTGVRAIDALLTCGQGQRIGVFAGSGVGKSVTLGMMTRYTDADVVVVGLIGERGREVNDFIERELGTEGRKKSVVVVSTSSEPPLMRVRAAYAAISIAEYFRDQGKNVLFLMDSLTRFAMAQREIGLAAGEPPTSRGYTPSVFALLPRLVERAGRSDVGSVTAFFTVLVEGDDKHDPICDAVRGLLDGHIWLSRKLSARGYYPAIDVLESVSRLAPDVCSREHWELANEVRKILGVYADAEDLISVGAYRRGSSPDIDRAIAMKPKIDDFLRQQIFESSTFDETLKGLKSLFVE